MEKLLRYALPLALLGVASASDAQSSVTLYGLVDAGLVYTNNSGGHSNYQLGNGLLSGSRWGLLGSEDLGSGLKAIFTLENGFNPSNGKFGQNGREFGRQAFVGLSDSRFGTVTLGRQYQSNFLGLDALVQGSLATHPYDNDNLGASIRLNNSVKYQSANYGGFRFGGLYGFSNAAGSFADSRAYDVSASYANGGLTLASSYLQINNVGSTTNTSGTVVAGDSPFYAARQRTWGAGARYTFDTSTVGFVFTQTQLSNATAIGSGYAGTSSNLPLKGNARFTNYELNGSYRFTPALTLLGAYTYTDSHLNGERPKYQQITCQAGYALSKRTVLIMQAAYEHVSNSGKSGVTADISGVSSSSTSSQFVTEFGIHHTF
ncbi:MULTISPECIES: porin [Paraburkholderia]|uniref:Porin n=1 Tax=Paraburkholderia podalyriae TaxID=1938811 RepID=A0ABR7PU28_9BURK|nr:porin [Paraburkholderia podalyriae]MBC8749776.1 porin [Paraburkholderia podalyriae]